LVAVACPKLPMMSTAATPSVQYLRRKLLKHMAYLSEPDFADNAVATTQFGRRAPWGVGHFEMRGNVVTKPRIWDHNMSKVQ
jgi:hypothetical protein